MASDELMAEAAKMVQQLLDLVADGSIDAKTPAARRLVQRLQGAQMAWELSASFPPPPPPLPPKEVITEWLGKQEPKDKSN